MKGRVVLKSIMKNLGNQQTSGKNRNKHLKKRSKTVQKCPVASWHSPSMRLQLNSESSVQYRKFNEEGWYIQMPLLCQAKWENLLPQCRSINNLNPLGISGTLRHFQDRTVVNSRPAAFSRRYRVVSGLLGVLTTSSSCCFSGWKDMSGRPYHVWMATTLTDLESQLRPSQDPHHAKFGKGGNSNLEGISYRA